MRRLRNPKAMTGILMVAAFVGGVLITLCGHRRLTVVAVEAKKMASGKYFVSFSEPNGFGTVILDITRDDNRFVVLLYDDSDPRLVGLPEKKLHMRETSRKQDMPYLVVGQEDDTKTFVPWHPNEQPVKTYNTPPTQ